MPAFPTWTHEKQYSEKCEIPAFPHGDMISDIQKNCVAVIPAFPHVDRGLEAIF